MGSDTRGPVHEELAAGLGALEPGAPLIPL